MLCGDLYLTYRSQLHIYKTPFTWLPGSRFTKTSFGREWLLSVNVQYRKRKYLWPYVDSETLNVCPAWAKETAKHGFFVEVACLQPGLALVHLLHLWGPVVATGDGALRVVRQRAERHMLHDVMPYFLGVTERACRRSNYATDKFSPSALLQAIG